MFKKIVVAHRESPEAERALSAGIQLAKSLNADCASGGPHPVLSTFD